MKSQRNTTTRKLEREKDEKRKGEDRRRRDLQMRRDDCWKENQKMKGQIE